MSAQAGAARRPIFTRWFSFGRSALAHRCQCALRRAGDQVGTGDGRGAGVCRTRHGCGSSAVAILIPIVIGRRVRRVHRQRTYASCRTQAPTVWLANLDPSGTPGFHRKPDTRSGRCSVQYDLKEVVCSFAKGCRRVLVRKRQRHQPLERRKNKLRQTAIGHRHSCTQLAVGRA